VAKKKTSRIAVTQRRSSIGRPWKHRRTLRALGFTRHQQTRIHQDTPQIRGMIAQVQHLPHLRELDDQFEIAGLCDLSGRLLEVVGAEYGLPPERCHTDYEAMLASDVEAVIVCPSADHAAPSMLRLADLHPLGEALRDLDRRLFAAEQVGRRGERRLANGLDQQFGRTQRDRMFHPLICEGGCVLSRFLTGAARLTQMLTDIPDAHPIRWSQGRWLDQ
jgi:large subunit ribosomal protein L30